MRRAFAAAARSASTVAVAPNFPSSARIDGRLPGFLPSFPLTFSYALNFFALSDARARYGSDLELEKVLLIARLDPSGRVTFLPTTSPGADLVTATVGGPGRYLVAAPRS